MSLPTFQPFNGTEPLVLVLDVCLGQGHVPVRHRKVGVTEHLPKREDASPGSEEHDGERVSERVR